jgi:hypothetical protein
MSTQAKVAIEKREHPERFCPAYRCLWRTAKLNHATGLREGGGYCPRHKPREVVRQPRFTVMDWMRNDFQFKRDAAEVEHAHL